MSEIVIIKKDRNTMNISLQDAIKTADKTHDNITYYLDAENEAVYVWLRGKKIGSSPSSTLALVSDTTLPDAWRKTAYSSEKVRHYLSKHHMSQTDIKNIQDVLKAFPLPESSNEKKTEISSAIPVAPAIPSAHTALHIHKITAHKKSIKTDIPTLINRVCQLIEQGSILAVPVKRQAQWGVGKTDMAVYSRINAALSTNVDFSFLSAKEGGQWQRGYFPLQNGVIIGGSGMTIATGFDVGQWTVEAMKGNFKLPESIILKLYMYAANPRGKLSYGIATTDVTPDQSVPQRSVERFKKSLHLTNIIAPSGRLTGKTRSAINQLVAARGPVPILSKEEADTVDECVHQSFLEYIRDAWNSFAALSNNLCPEFIKIPSGWQTALLSRGFQSGQNFLATDTLKAFRECCKKADWQGALTAWKNLTLVAPYSHYPGRVLDELALMTADVKSLPVPPKTPSSVKSSVKKI